jgi:RNA polymerase sigma-70 factor (ECF subfamily)
MAMSSGQFSEEKPQTEEELVRLARAGNAEAFTLLFLRYKGPIRAYLASLVGNIEEADDLTQRAFLNAWDKLLTLQDESRFKPWIFTIARNLAHDHLRQQAKNPSQSFEPLKERNDTGNNINFEDETAAKELVKLALAELPPKYRDGLLLSIQGGFSFDEIAEFLKISKTSVSTYIATARRLFRQAYSRLKDEAEQQGESYHAAASSSRSSLAPERGERREPVGPLELQDEREALQNVAQGEFEPEIDLVGRGGTGEGAVRHFKRDMNGKPEAESEHPQTPTELEARISHLPETYRQSLHLKLIDRRSDRQIAAQLGLSLGTVKSHISRGRKLLLTPKEER